MSNRIEEKEETVSTAWMQTLWRPMMGWMYMLICLADMMVFPVLWALWQGVNHVPITQWNPLTLQGAGLFHIAMGAVLGIAAFGRTQEKLAGTAANPTATTQNINMTGNVSGGYGSIGATNMNNSMVTPSPYGATPMNSPYGASPMAPNTMGGFARPVAPAPTFTPPMVAPPTSSKSVVPQTGFPPL